MSLGHQDPGDLGLLLGDMKRQIETLTQRSTPGEWQNFVPNVRATTTNPNKGTNPIKKGRYVVTSHGTCEGRATMRFGSSMSRGEGIYMLKLPLPAKSVDPRGFDPLNGGVTWGVDSGLGSHEVGGALHLCGLSGFRSNLWAVATIENALFAADTNVNAGGLASDDILNIHYWFAYELDDEE